MANYSTKRRQVEAVQWTGSNFNEIFEVIDIDAYYTVNVTIRPNLIEISLKDEILSIPDGDFLVNDGSGKLNVLSSKEFDETYGNDEAEVDIQSYITDITNVNKMLADRYLTMIIDGDPLHMFAKTLYDSINMMPIDKQSRWIGFLQGALIRDRKLTERDERSYTRKLFKPIYEKYGMSTETIDVKRGEE